MSTLWHVCPACGLAGPVSEPNGFYCLQHREPDSAKRVPPSDDARDWTAVEQLALKRRLSKDPPNLRDWIERYGGYARISPEGWADYEAAKALSG